MQTLTIGAACVPISASWQRQIEVWLNSLRHQPRQATHITSTDMVEQQAILACIAWRNQADQPINEPHAVAKLEQQLSMHA